MAKKLLSEFIAECQQLYAEYGDIPIQIFSYDGEGETEDPVFCQCEEEDGTVSEISLGDSSWADAFFEGGDEPDA